MAFNPYQQSNQKTTHEKEKQSVETAQTVSENNRPTQSHRSKRGNERSLQNARPPQKNNRAIQNNRPPQSNESSIPTNRLSRENERPAQSDSPMEMSDKSAQTQPRSNVNRSKEVAEEIHRRIGRFTLKRRNNDSDTYRYGALLAAMCRNDQLKAGDYAQTLKREFGLNIEGEDVAHILRKWRLVNLEKRRCIFQWAAQIAECYIGAVSGSREQFDKLEALRKESITEEFSDRGHKERIAAIMIYEKCPTLDMYNDREILMMSDRSIGKNYFYQMYDSVCDVYGFPYFLTEKKHSSSTREKNVSYEDAIVRIEHLEEELERTNEMLVELQEEFDRQLEECKLNELTTFFARLNSNRYGNILDQLLQVRKGIEMLRRQDYELPLQVNGLFIMTKQLIEFTRDSHIAPIMPMNVIKEVTATDVEFCDYEGSAFVNDTEKKKVVVVSPGWIYKDQNVQISRPKVREISYVEESQNQRRV